MKKSDKKQLLFLFFDLKRKTSSGKTNIKINKVGVSIKKNKKLLFTLLKLPLFYS